MITDEALTQAIQQASQAADGIVRIDVLGVQDASKVNVQLPAGVFDENRDAGIQRIEVNTGITKLSVAADALNGKLDSETATIEFSVEEADKAALPEEIQQKVGNRKVYDFNAFADGRQISQFNGRNPVQITLDYTLEEGEDPHKIVVYYIDDLGELKAVTNTKYDAESKTVTFSTTHFSKYVLMHAEVNFSDSISFAWAKEYIEALAAREVINGLPDGSFGPDAPVTREQFAKMLINAFDLVDDNAECTFDDVAENTWYYRYAASAQKLGIIGGIGNNRFGAGLKITRQDMVVMATRALEAIGTELPEPELTDGFSDMESIADYAKEAVITLKTAGVVDGVKDGRFAPTADSTRAQAAKVIYLLLMLK